jgi:hypothetical protein
MTCQTKEENDRKSLRPKVSKKQKAMRDVYALMINNIIAVGYQTTRWSPARQLLKHLRDTLFEDLLEPARRAWCCLFYG